MGIVYKTVDKEGFKADMAILTCEATGKNLVEFIIREKDNPRSPTTSVKALSPYSPKSSSGTHKIKGLLSYGPIESKSQKTIINDVTPSESSTGELLLILDVGIG